MNRRKFLTALGLAPLVAKFAPLLKLLPEPVADFIPYWMSYRFRMTVTLPPNSNSRIRYIDSIDSLNGRTPIPPRNVSYRTYIMAQDGILP